MLHSSLDPARSVTQRRSHLTPRRPRFPRPRTSTSRDDMTAADDDIDEEALLYGDVGACARDGDVPNDEARAREF